MDWLHLQIGIALIFQSLNAWLVVPMRFFSFLGTEQFYLLIMPALYWCAGPELGVRMAIALLFSTAINNAMKLVFHLPRPYWIDSRVQALANETSFGLPSGHAQNATAIWGSLGYAVRRIWLQILAFLVILLIGISRLYLGVHFLSDVLAGWLIGGLLLFLMIRLDRPITSWLKRLPFANLLWLVLLVSLSLVLLSILPRLALLTWQVPTEWAATALAAAPTQPIDPLNIESSFSLGGTGLGMFGGMVWLFRKGGGFKTAGNPRQLVLRYLIGLFGVLILWYGLDQIFPANPLAVGYALRFLRYALVGIWISAIAPIVFRRLHLSK